MKMIFCLFLIVFSNASFSQVDSFYVSPIVTDMNYASDQDRHLVLKNASFGIDKLFLFFGGTRSSPEDYINRSSFAAGLGFDVINLSYPNSVAAYSLSNNRDSLAFDKYRDEICFGTPSSPRVEVDSLNSIYTRTVKLLNYLDGEYPADNWGQYLLDEGSLNSSKILVGGHSQGAGHACYLAKYNEYERVLMFSGPNDYSSRFESSANWLGSSATTILDRQFVYLSLLDEVVDFQEQLSNLTALGLYPIYDSTLVDHRSIPFENSRCLHTMQPPGLAILNHNSTVIPSIKNDVVWTYMLTSDISTETAELDRDRNFLIYPNPSSSVVRIDLKEELRKQPYKLRNVSGQVVLSGDTPKEREFSIDLSELESGLYFLSLGNRTARVLKR